MLRFPAQILPMMGFSSYDDSDVFQWLKLVSIGGSCSEPFSRLHQSPPPPQPSAPPPPPKPPKASTPSPFSGAQDDLDCFKAECSLYLSMRHSEFPDECSNVLFILLYMKGGTAGPWATQKINSILYLANAEEVMWAGFVLELDEMFVDPNHQATAQRKLATLHQGDGSVEELI